MLKRRMISSALLCLAVACQGRGLQPVAQSATTPTTNPTPATTTSVSEVAPVQPSTTATTEPDIPETVPVTRPRPTPTTTLAETLAVGEWAIPTYIVMCESGGRWDAYNPYSGASGPYQMLPMHFGGELAMNQSHAAQHAKAAALWDGGRGRAHWRACL